MFRLRVNKPASKSQQVARSVVLLPKLFLLLMAYHQLKTLITELTPSTTNFQTNNPTTDNFQIYSQTRHLLLAPVECGLIEPQSSSQTNPTPYTNNYNYNYNHPIKHAAIESSTSHMNQKPPGARNLVLVHHQAEQPDFVEPIGNHTVAVGRDAQLACKISNLGNYRTAWLRVEDKGILTIHNNVITRNYRFGLMNNEDEQSFVLTIKNVQPSDKGGYMCQINSVPMKYAVGYLDVLTPPIFDNEPLATNGSGSPSEADSTSNEQLQQQQPANSSQVSVVEGSSATLTCVARGHPMPSITWRREDGRPIMLNGLLDPSADLDNAPTEIKDTSSLSFAAVNRLNSGAYLCIASNGVQPSASKRQLLDVRYSPTITVPQTEISGRPNEAEAQLECLVDSNPAGSYHWVKLATSTTNTDRKPMVANQEDDLWLIEHDELTPSDKFDIVIKQMNSEKVRMILIIRQVEKQDFSWYKCIARNSLGLQSNFVRFYELPLGQTAASAAAATTTASSSFSFKNIIRLNDFVGGGSAQTNGRQQQQQDDNKLNLPQNDDSRLSFQRTSTSSSSSSSSSARSSAWASPMTDLLSDKQFLVPFARGQSSHLTYNCQFAALVSLVVMNTLLNLSTRHRHRLAWGPQIT